MTASDIGRFDGTRIVVGGTGPIAAAIARSFTGLGGTVVIAGPAVLEQAEGVHVVEADASTEAGVQLFAQRALAILGGVDVIVDCAESQERMPVRFLDLADDDVRHDINANFMAAMRLDRALMPSLIEQRSGAIIHVTSGQPQSAGAAKLSLTPVEAALTSYSKSLATTLREHGIRVNTAIAGQIGEHASVDAVSSTPLGTPASAERVAELVVFLASPRADFITGAQYIVDGGAHRGIQI